MQNPKKLEELYTAAIKVFGKFGYKKATVEDIAAEMGWTKGAIYSYVKSKKDLYDKAVKSRMRKWLKKAMEALEEQGDIKEKFGELCRKSFLYLSQDVELKQLLINDPKIFPLTLNEEMSADKMKGNILYHFKMFFEEGIRQDCFKEYDTTILTNLLYSMYKMIILETCALEEQEAYKTLDLAIELVAKGLYK
ncbi:MAG: TetR/AcrR family transcriptional regulator [Christensenellales bacterium]|jgi:AcrR family transcriptional regulator|nr:TetR/AcrR family transcriptional regulator [Clostridiales bacterium]